MLGGSIPEVSMIRRLSSPAGLVTGLLCVLSLGTGALGQSSSATLTQTINKAQTVTSIHSASTAGGPTLPGQSVTLYGVVSSGLSTTGITSPTDTVAFDLNGSALGSPVTVTPITNATNLLPYSQSVTKWTNIGSPTVTDNAIAGPFDNGSCTGSGCSNTTASTIVFPAASTSSPVGISYNVPTTSGVSLAGQTVTFSAWVGGAAHGSLNLLISDGAGANGMAAITFPVPTSYTRVERTVTIPATFGNGFTVTLESTSATVQTVNLQGLQFEQGAYAGPYVLTTGAAISNGFGALATYVLASGFAPDANHSTNAINAAYVGDANYIGSTSPTLYPNVGQGTATITLAAVPTASTYGQNVAFTATITGDGSPFVTGGSLTITYGSSPVTLTTCTPTNGSTAAWTCPGSLATLPVGTTAITATYSGDPNYGTASGTLNYIVGQANATVAVTSAPSPSTYGQQVNFNLSITSNNGAAAGVAIPTGSFTVYDCGGNTASATCSGAVTLGTYSITSGSASFNSSVLTGGTHNVYVTYSGDTNYTASN